MLSAYFLQTVSKRCVISLYFLWVTGNNNKFRAEFLRFPCCHASRNAACFCLTRRSGDDGAHGTLRTGCFAANGDSFPTQEGIRLLFDACEVAVEVDVHDNGHIENYE